MLKKIPKILSPELVYTLMSMGHGDTIVLADGNFPAETFGQRVVRADGHGVPELLAAVLELMPLDVEYTDSPVSLMAVVEGDTANANPAIWGTYRSVIDAADPRDVSIEHIERYAFYEKAKHAYAVVATGEEAVYANILLTKGVVK